MVTLEFAAVGKGVAAKLRKSSTPSSTTWPALKVVPPFTVQFAVPTESLALPLKL